MQFRVNSATTKSKSEHTYRTLAPSASRTTTVRNSCNRSMRAKDMDLTLQIFFKKLQTNQDRILLKNDKTSTHYFAAYIVDIVRLGAHHLINLPLKYMQI